MNEYQMTITIVIDAGSLNALTGTASISGAIELNPKSLLEDMAEIGATLAKRLYRSQQGIVKDVAGVEDCVMSMASELFDNIKGKGTIVKLASRNLDDMFIKVEALKLAEGIE